MPDAHSGYSHDSLSHDLDSRSRYLLSARDDDGSRNRLSGDLPATLYDLSLAVQARPHSSSGLRSFELALAVVTLGAGCRSTGGYGGAGHGDARLCGTDG